MSPPITPAKISSSGKSAPHKNWAQEVVEAANDDGTGSLRLDFRVLQAETCHQSLLVEKERIDVALKIVVVSAFAVPVSMSSIGATTVVHYFAPPRTFDQHREY